MWTYRYTNAVQKVVPYWIISDLLSIITCIYFGAIQKLDPLYVDIRLTLDEKIYFFFVPPITLLLIGLIVWRLVEYIPLIFPVLYSLIDPNTKDEKAFFNYANRRMFLWNMLNVFMEFLFGSYLLVTSSPFLGVPLIAVGVQIYSNIRLAPLTYGYIDFDGVLTKEIDRN